MNEPLGRPSPARGSRLALLACALAAGATLAALPAHAIVDASAVTLLAADDTPAPVPPAVPQAMAGAASDALLASPMLRARTSAGAMPERGNMATARRRHLAVGGLDRSYLVQPAPGARGAGRLPVVVLLHGGTQSAEDIWRETSLPTLGAREGFLVVAPDALGHH